MIVLADNSEEKGILRVVWELYLWKNILCFLKYKWDLFFKAMGTVTCILSQQRLKVNIYNKVKFSLVSC